MSAGLSASVQMVAVRRNIPPVENEKGGKSKSGLHGPWAVVAGSLARKKGKNPLANVFLFLFSDMNENKKKYMEDAFQMLPGSKPIANVQLV